MEENELDTLRMSTGVVFRTKPVAVMALQAINRELTKLEPEVPNTYIEGKDRWEHNPNDPDYIAALKEHELNADERRMDMIVALGTEVEALPESFPRPPSLNGATPQGFFQRFGRRGIRSHGKEPWVLALEAFGIPIPDEHNERYAAWVKLCAAPTVQDYTGLILACTRKSGVTEEDVAAAVASFPDPEKR